MSSGAMNLISVTHSKSGTTAKVHPFGATVVSFVPSGKHEVLFLSNIAKMDGTKAIRGGIPLVFPQFGRPDSSMPQHGFLRTNLWTVVGGEPYDTEEAAGLTLTLPLKQAVHSRGGKWSLDETAFDCVVFFHVQVTASSLVTTLTIDNTGSNPFDFQTLQHTYLKVENALDPKKCNVTGLQRYECEDKITDETYNLGPEPVIIDCNVDRIYTNKEKKNLGVKVQTGAETSVQVEATGTVDGQPIAISGVVWNPHEEKAKEMSDFGDEQYKEMICVEPGMLYNVPAVKKKAVFTQTLTAL
jgi:glucose-6-phosphate 1-epimerase